jgi:hypothetical protein
MTVKQEQRSDSEQLGEPVTFKNDNGNIKMTVDASAPLVMVPHPAFQQRTWVGLTDDDWDEVLEDFPHIPDINDFQKIEAKLKAKNERKEKNT